MSDYDINLFNYDKLFELCSEKDVKIFATSSIDDDFELYVYKEMICKGTIKECMIFMKGWSYGLSNYLKYDSRGADE